MNALLLIQETEKAQEHGESLGEFIMHHIQDSHEWNLFGYKIELPHLPPFHLFGIKIDMSITLHVLMMWFAAVILILLFGLTFRRKQLVPRGLAAILESITLFVRDEIAIPTMGERRGRYFTPFLATMFFFILTCNLMGLVPIFATATGNISVTASLAIVTFIAIQLYGMIENGVIGYWKNLAPHGLPWPMYFILVPLEFLGMFTKPFALAMRLFANMLAGHTVILALLSLIIAVQSIIAAPFSIGMALFIALLEILVAFIQAYIFTILSSLFIGMAMHPEH